MREQGGKAGPLKRLWEKTREHASNALIGGAILVLTGFTPEHWVAEIVHNLHLSDFTARWPTALDPRLFVLSLGVVVIVGDLLWRRHAPVALRAATPATPAADSGGSESSNLSVPDQPSIAVLPFQNISGDPEQEYFADGMVEDITTSLSRTRWLFVIARNSSFTYKGRTVGVKQVGRELGVRYVLEGSVRKAAGRVRITVQLADCGTGVQLWADRVDGALEDIFDLQDKVSASIVSAIAPRLQRAEIERAKRKPTESLDAYDYYLRGLARNLTQRADNDEARLLFAKAIERDPDFASAYGMTAACYVQRKACGWMTDHAAESAEVARLARRAAELGGDDSAALAQAGYALGFVVGDLDGSAAMIDRALELNPNVAESWYFSGFVAVYRGEPEIAIERLARAMRISPRDPLLFYMHAATAYAHFLLGRHSEALHWAKRALLENPDHSLTNRIGAAVFAVSGQRDEAQACAAHLLCIDPAFRVSKLSNYVPLRRSEDVAALARALRQAGLPE